ncbi:MAG TPA: UDP-3-O-(3-hydroxymyristoyl)glucosamine N-acyltransferase [Saprospiraceae bacterium]|nr:UDP-3-O-(3-hydroxymyristoyl)glucosamine N-acyltransferase [Saprospiraceae bacterium]
MEVTVSVIAQLVNGTIEGDPNMPINRPSRIEDGGEGSISFFGNPKYEAYVYETDASALLVPESFKPKKAIQPTLIKVPDVYAAIATLLEAFGAEAQAHPSGISDRAQIANSADLGQEIAVGAFSCIGENSQIGDQSIIDDQVYIGRNVRIGRKVRLFSGVRILDGCEVGDGTTIHANTVIGSDGFGFAPQEDGSFKKIPQLGNVVIEDRVEIGANCTIDRGSIGATVIRKGAKLDNLIQVAHNVEIGEHTVIAAQTGIAGSTKIGKHCFIGGQVGFVGHIEIADGTRVQAQSGIMSSIKEKGTDWFGYPAFAYRDYLKSYALFRQLPKISKKLRELENKLNKNED